MAKASDSLEYKTIAKQQLRRLDDGSIQLCSVKRDIASSEQPLQLVLHYVDFNVSAGKHVWLEQELALLMRTPGDDKALVLGFLFTQGIIAKLTDIESLDFSEQNTVDIRLAETVAVDFEQLQRHFPSHSGCGICGQSQLKQLGLSYPAFEGGEAWLVANELLTAPERLREGQLQFQSTGGCHGVGLLKLDLAGHLAMIFVAEDVGRHNALDKVIGSILEGGVSVEHTALVFSGRVSFELVQKAVVAGISVILSIGAPSDLAIATAQQFNMTLIGFIRDEQANVYHDAGRLIGVAQNTAEKEQKAQEKGIGNR